MDLCRAEDDPVLMQADSLAQLLSLTALIGATIEYAEILKRRKQRRQLTAMQQESAQTGLRGLVRVFLTDGATGEDALESGV